MSLAKANKAAPATAGRVAGETRGARGAAMVPPRSGIAFADERASPVGADGAAGAFVQRACKCGAKPQDGDCAECKRAAPVIQRAKRASKPAAAPVGGGLVPIGGRALDPGVRRSMERGFGESFGDVRVHTGPAAERSAEALGARAFAYGRDIVFNRGEYRPDTREGRHLLAHELAHTIQQGGVQRSAAGAADAGADTGADNPRLEAEAVRAASAVISGGPRVPLTRVGVMAPMRTTSGRTYGVDAPTSLAGLVERMSEVYRSPDGHTVQAFWMTDPFPLPATKGSLAHELWAERAKAGALETVWKRGTKVALKQARDATVDLRASWLKKVGWDPAKASESWSALRCSIQGKPPATPADTTFRPVVAGAGGKDEVCHMDHVVELQMQGTNVPQNVALLDGADNMSSGRSISRDIARWAGAIEVAVPEPEYLILHFESVQSIGTPVAGPCVQMENAALGKPAASRTGEGCGKISAAGALAKGVKTYSLRAGGSTAVVEYEAARASVGAPIEGAAADLVPGLQLATLHPRARRTHVFAAFANTGGKGAARVPLSLAPAGATDAKTRGTANPAGIRLDVVDDVGTLKSTSPENVGLRFHYPYLSEGKITKLDMSPSGIAGEGRLRPSIPLLSALELGLRFGPGLLELVGSIPKEKLKLPIRGVEITRAELSLLLYPEFKPSGTVAFRVGTEKNPVLLGALTVGADAEGFFARGEVQALLPGVKEAKGQVEYRKSTGLTGFVHVDAAQFRLPGMTVKQGTLDVRFGGTTGIDAVGKIIVGLPREQEAELQLSYRNQKWRFDGRGNFRVPPLKDFLATVCYDGDNLIATGKTSLDYRGFAAAVDVHYRNGKVHGKGKLDFQKGRVKGHAKVDVDDQMKLSGTGSVTVEISKDLIATAGIELHKDGKVKVTGAITVPKPIVLFAGFGARKNLFALRKTFPVPGLAVGPLGVQAVIGAGLDVNYSIGPASLVGTTLTLALNPFDDKPDPEVGVKSSLVLPANAGLSASITGGLELEAGLARVGGDIKITGGANLTGKAGADVDIKYKAKRLEVKGHAGIEAGLVLDLGVKASLFGEVGLWKFKKRWTKEWDLVNRKLDTGLGFRIRAPFRYATGEGATLPSVDQLQIDRPQLDAKAITAALVRNASTKEKEG